jgi:hypothetical protein
MPFAEYLERVQKGEIGVVSSLSGGLSDTETEERTRRETPCTRRTSVLDYTGVGSCKSSVLKLRAQPLAPTSSAPIQSAITGHSHG